MFVPVCAVSTLPFPLNLSLSFHLPPNSRLPLQHTYTRVCCACFSPPLIQIIFASRNGNEVHLRAERVRLQRACCSLSVWLTEDLGSLKGDDEKDAEIYPPLSLLALHIQKKTFVLLLMLLHTAERPAVGVWFPASPAKCEVLIVQGDQQSPVFGSVVHLCYQNNVWYSDRNTVLSARIWFRISTGHVDAI